MTLLKNLFVRNVPGSSPLNYLLWYSILRLGYRDKLNDGKVRDHLSITFVIVKGGVEGSLFILLIIQQSPDTLILRFTVKP